MSEEWRLARFASLKRELQDAGETPGGPPPVHLFGGSPGARGNCLGAEAQHGEAVEKGVARGG
eukprot:6784080-Alexandrium_andersonii.AAC.1